MTDSAVTQFWSSFLDSRREDLPPDITYYEAFTFGSQPDSASQLAALVLSGAKTATSSSVREYEERRQRPPASGDYSIVLDGHGTPVCVIQTIEVNVIPFDQVDAAFAYDYGEGDRTLVWWRENMGDYYDEEFAANGWERDAALPLICERFRVDYAPSLTAGANDEP
jgi:uncharacterized protein YhfF